MGKKDGFKDIWCENRSVSKCNSRTRIWNDSSIPAIEYKHSDACRMKKKREKESNQVSQSTRKKEKLPWKSKEEESRNSTKEKVKDFIVDYIDPKKKEIEEKKFPGNTILKEIQEQAEQEFQNNEVTVSNVVRFTHKLDELGMAFYLDEIIRRVLKHEKEALFQLYREAFINFDRNDVMSSWVNNCKSIGLFKFTELIGAATFKRFVVDNQSCYQILLLGVWKKYKLQGYGKKLIEYLKSKCNNIVLWSDKQSVGFYSKLGFEQRKEIQQLTEEEVKFETNSVFLSWGFKEIQNDDSEL